MGTCASVQYSRNRGKLMITNGSSSTAKVIHSIDGRLQEFRQPIAAGNVISGDQSEAFFLCNAEHMFVNCHVPHVPVDEELQLGQIYFVLPMTMSYRPITLSEICVLAIKASSVLQKSEEVKTMKTMKMKKKMSGTTSFKGRKRNGDVRRYQKVDFQLALKQLA